jgi:hypothetical protein
VTATGERFERRTPVSEVRRVVFDLPVWLLALVAVGANLARFGLADPGIRYHLAVARDPFTELSFPWLYQSPVGYMAAWLVGVDTAGGLRIFHLALLAASLVGCGWIVARWVSPFAARLFILAWFCSPVARHTTMNVGFVSDIVTVAGLTVATIVVTPAAGFAVGGLLGVNHFEQSVIALAAVAVLRVKLRGEAWRVMCPVVVGLVVGRVVLAAYLAAAGINPNGRGEFLSELGVGTLLEATVPLVPDIVWACYAVLWVAVLWMARQLPALQRRYLITAQTLLLLPVLVTADVARVYQLLTWPIVVLMAVWYSDQPDQRRTELWALGLCVAAFFVPYVDVNAPINAGRWLIEIRDNI